MPGKLKKLKRRKISERQYAAATGEDADTHRDADADHPAQPRARVRNLHRPLLVHW